tara:strand:- start:1067 stop:1309 length:243 start_codon:yes stop_codon:yes gene_type:complete
MVTQGMLTTKATKKKPRTAKKRTLMVTNERKEVLGDLPGLEAAGVAEEEEEEEAEEEREEEARAVTRVSPDPAADPSAPG